MKCSTKGEERDPTGPGPGPGLAGPETLLVPSSGIAALLERVVGVLENVGRDLSFFCKHQTNHGKNVTLIISIVVVKSITSAIGEEEEERTTNDGTGIILAAK